LTRAVSVECRWR